MIDRETVQPRDTFVLQILNLILYIFLYIFYFFCGATAFLLFSLTGNQALVIRENLTSHFPCNGLGGMCGDIAARGC